MDQPLTLFPEPDPDPPVEGKGSDPGLEKVVAWFAQYGSGLEEVLGNVLRRSIDEVLDGQRTARYDIEQLAKTEKTYLGTKVEVVCQAEFGFPRGSHMDYLIAGEEVDCKFALTFGGWAIPREAVGQICLLLHADDVKSRFSAGVIRTTSDVLGNGVNQDGKRRLSPAGRVAVHWLVREGDLPENLLLSLPPGVRALIFDGETGSRNSGQARV